MGLVNKYLQQHKTQGVTRESRSYTPRQQTRGNLEIGQYLNNCNCQAQESAIITGQLVNVGVNFLFGNLIPSVVSLFSRNKTNNINYDINPETKGETNNTTKNLETIETILKNNNVEVTDEILEKVAEKYPTMKEIQTGGLSVEQRVINYANGLKYNKVTDSFINAKLNDTTSSEVYNIKLGEGNDTAEKVKSGFIQLAQEQIELYDNEKQDGKISFNEYLAKELADVNISAEDLTTNEFNAVYASVNTAFKALDANHDTFLDKEEMASFTWVQSTIDNSEKEKFANNITYQEWDSSDEILNLYKNIVLEKLPSDKLKEFCDLKLAGGAALPFLKEHSTATAEEITLLADFFKRYDQSFSGFKEFTKK